MTDAERNEKIAEWFESKPNGTPLAPCRSPKGFWTRLNEYHAERPWVASYDFLHDPAANELLLDAMKPNVALSFYQDEWWCDPDNERGDMYPSHHLDRKTAVVLAFEAWLESKRPAPPRI